jgi:hypothetical protein
MSKNKTWAPPGWPWELDLLTLAFLVMGVLIPYNLFTQHMAESSLAANQAVVKLKEQTYILWSIGLCLLYVMHLALSGAGDDALSIPGGANDLSGSLCGPGLLPHLRRGCRHAADHPC